MKKRFTALLVFFALITATTGAYATVIIGLVQDGVVYMGADSAGINSRSGALTILADRKVFRNGEFLIGVSGSHRMLQLLRYKCNFPPQKKEQSIEEYLVVTFVDEIRQCFKDGGFGLRSGGQEFGGFFLVGYRGKLFLIESDFQVASSPDFYMAIGSAGKNALGSLFSTEDLDFSPRRRVEIALEAAEHANAFVRSPFHILSLSPPSSQGEGE